MTKIVAIDGVCRSGKSTVIETLTRNNPKIGKIQEYSDYANEEYPTFPPASPAIQVENVRNYMFQLELRRLDDLKKLKSKETVLVDRCYATSCAFDYAASVETGFDVAAEVELIWSNNADKIQPDKIVILDVEYQEQMRRLGTDIHRFVPILYNPAFNQRFKQYLMQNARIFSREVVIIDTTLLTPEQVYARVQNEI